MKRASGSDPARDDGHYCQCTKENDGRHSVDQWL